MSETRSYRLSGARGMLTRTVSGEDDAPGGDGLAASVAGGRIPLPGSRPQHLAGLERGNTRRSGSRVIVADTQGRRPPVVARTVGDTGVSPTVQPVLGLSLVSSGVTRPVAMLALSAAIEQPRLTGRLARELHLPLGAQPRRTTTVDALPRQPAIDHDLAHPKRSQQAAPPSCQSVRAPRPACGPQLDTCGAQAPDQDTDPGSGLRQECARGRSPGGAGSAGPSHPCGGRARKPEPSATNRTASELSRPGFHAVRSTCPDPRPRMCRPNRRETERALWRAPSPRSPVSWPISSRCPAAPPAREFLQL